MATIELSNKELALVLDALDRDLDNTPQTRVKRVVEEQIAVRNRLDILFKNRKKG